MRSFFALLFLGFFIPAASAQVTASNTALPDPAKEIQVVPISCGKCKFGLAGSTCALAVRINKKAYYVDGADIDSFGDAHEKDGMCNAVRKAEVQGELADKRFKATYIRVLPNEKNR